MPYGEQLKRKQALLGQALGGQGFDPLRLLSEPPAGSARAFGYRSHARLVFRRQRSGRVLLGVYRPGSHTVVSAEQCRVHHPGLEPLLVELRAAVEDLGLPVHDELSGAGGLRYALARVAEVSGARHLTLVSSLDPLPGLTKLVGLLQTSAARPESLFVAHNPSPGNALLDGPPRRLFGPRLLLERFSDIQIGFRPESFSQANPQTAARAYATAGTWLRLKDEAIIADLYCGVGAFGLVVARPGDQIFGVEAAEASIVTARENAHRLRRKAAYATGVVDGRIRELWPGLAATATVEVALVNPPRRGLGPEGRAAVASLMPTRIAYLSCNPLSLAADLHALEAFGYSVERVRAFDMLPQTPHIEALALLQRL